MPRIKVIVNGAAGRMGREVVKAVSTQKDMELVAACDLKEIGRDAGRLAGLDNLGVVIGDNLAEAIKETGAEVVVDFSHPKTVAAVIRTILDSGAMPVVGTTGITEGDLKEVKELASARKLNAVIAPNFAIGAVLMMKFAAEAIRHLPKAEIIELHHDQKLDAPSGTALRTQLLMGAKVPIHSVRLPGLVAHQEVIFGDVGQTLTIRHDSISRESFMPGVLLAIRKVKDISGVIFGLENLL